MAATGKYTASTVFKAVDQYTNPVKAMSRTTGNFATKAQAGFLSVERSARKLNKTTNLLSSSMKGLVAGVGLTMALTGAATAAMTLDQNLSSAAAKFQIFDRESDTYKRLEDTARRFGSTTEFTAGQAAEGLEKLGVAGFKANQAMAGIGTTLDLATATQSELGETADFAGKALNAFALKSNDTEQLAQNLERVADSTNKLITTSGFGSLNEVLTTLGASGASAKAAGLSFETWAASVGKTVSAGVDASSAGSQLNMALTRLAKPTAAAQKLLDKHNITVADSAGNFRDFFDIIQDVEVATKGMGTATKAAFLSEIFGVRAQKAINVLLGQGAEAMRSYRNEIEGAAGQTEKMASFMRGGLSGVYKSLISALEEIGISMEATFRTEINDSIKGITEAARATGAWVKENKQLINTVGTAAMWFVKAKIALFGVQKAAMLMRGTMAAYNIIAATTNVLTGASVLKYRQQASAMVAARGAATALAVAQKAMQGPVGWIALGVTAATVAIIAYSKATMSAEKISKKFGASVQKNLFKETRKLDDYFEQLKRTNPESEKRKKILAEMQAQYPALLRDMDLIKAKEEEIEQARVKSTAALRTQIIEEATAAKKKEILAKSINKVSDSRDKLFDLGLTNEQVNRATELANRGMITSGSAMGLARDISVGGSTQRLVSEIISTMSRFGTANVDPQIQAIQDRASGIMNIPTDLEGAGIVKSETSTTSTQKQELNININDPKGVATVESSGNEIPSFFTTGFTGD